MSERITIEELADRLGVTLETHSWEDLQMLARGHWTDENHTHWEFPDDQDIIALAADEDIPVPRFTLQMVTDDLVLRDDLWTEWRVTNQGNPWIDSLPADPPYPVLEPSAWEQCLAWHSSSPKTSPAELTVRDLFDDDSTVVNWLAANYGFTGGGFKVVSMANTKKWPDTGESVTVVTLWVEDEENTWDGESKTPHFGQVIDNGFRYFLVAMTVSR